MCVRWAPTLGYSDIGVPITFGEYFVEGFIYLCIILF